MFAIKRIIRSKLNLKNHLYTSSTIRCNKPKDPDSKENKPKSRKKKTTASTESIAFGHSESKKKLTAEVNAKDYANFKSQKSVKVELYSNKKSQEEKLEAKKALESLTNEIESEGDIPINDKFQNLSVIKSKNIGGESKDEVVKSAKLVASELGGDVKKTEEDILGYLRKLEFKTEKRKFKGDNADIIIKEKQTSGRNFIADEEKYFRRNRPGFFRDRRIHSADREEGQLDFHKRNKDYRDNMNARRQFSESKIRDFISGKSISGFQPLGVFKANELKDDGPKLKTWDALKEWELKVAATVPPRNYFEELIQWTEEGKLWHFPIDNDQDNKLEENIDFTEHVFLEEYLEPWCPKKGPLRHFMELVLTGLAKNHYFSVEEKKEHIYWYRDYFEQKKKLLQEMGALDSGNILQESEESNSKSESSS